MLLQSIITPLLLLCTFAPVDARQTTRSDDCSTNAECIQNGLPLIRPRRPYRRQDPVQEFFPVSTTTCGENGTVFLTPGQYRVSLRGAAGAYEFEASDAGLGAVLTATLDVTQNTRAGYWVGCAGSRYGGVGGGGGGSFLFISGNTLLVAGGGGGAGYFSPAFGQPAGTSLDGRATNGDGTPGSQDGAGGTAPTTGTAGAGGGGFITAGSSVTDVSYGATGGAQSTNYGGNFAGGKAIDGSISETTGGAGGGGGAGYLGGGGGGGWSGGGGGINSNTQTSGGGGGGSYANPSIPGGITVTPGTIAATSTGMGSLTITRV